MATTTRARKPRRTTMTRWTTTLLLLLVAVVLAVHAQEQPTVSNGGGSVVATSDDAIELVDAAVQQAQQSVAKVPDFEPTEQWQDILPGQAIPPGLHVRLNLATGKREAKLLSDEDAEAESVQEPATVADEKATEETASVTVTTDVTGDIKAATTTTARGSESHALAVVEGEATMDDAQPDATAADTVEGSETTEALDEAPPAKEPNWNHEKIYEVLEALPEPPSIDGMDIHEARAKLSDPEFRRQMIKLWKKRQADLKEALNSLQDDAKYLGNLLEDFREAEKNGDTEGQLRVLEVLEWEVQDLDKTHVFNFIGGFGIMTEYLNSTNLPVRASASWLIGTAVKNYKDGQDWAINAGAIPKLVESLTLPVPADDIDGAAAAVFEVKKKAVYALSSLVRFNARAQRLLVSLGGPEKLSQLMDGRHPLGVQLKAVLFVHDLLYEESVQEPTGGDEDALGQLHEAFQSSVWCSHTAHFLKDNATKLQRNQQAETIQAMLAQLPSCKKDFAVANVKPTIESVVATWQTDASLDTDERQELVMVGNAVLSEL